MAKRRARSFAAKWAGPSAALRKPRPFFHPGSAMRSLSVLAAAGFSVLLMGAAPAPEYDLLIRGGRVIDGAGSPWVVADVAIKDGRFVKIGKVDGHGTREIDASGDYVTPGWIDSMDQSGEVLPINGKAENKVFEGVTTVIA